MNLQVTPLYQAAGDGDNERIKELLQTPNVNINQLCFVKTALEASIIARKESTALLLIDSGAQLDFEEGSNALHAASYHGLKEVTQAAIEKVLDINKPFHGGRPILWAVNGGHADTVDHLLQQGAKISDFEIHPRQESEFVMEDSRNSFSAAWYKQRCDIFLLLLDAILTHKCRKSRVEYSELLPELDESEPPRERLAERLAIWLKSWYWKPVDRETSYAKPNMVIRGTLELDSSHGGNFSPVLLAEVKRKKGSMREVEEQGLDAALKAINSQNLTGMYVITAVGLKYRAWYLSRAERELQPLHGSIKASWEYLHVKQQAGILNLAETIRLIKGEMPMRQAGVVPSQHIQLGHILQAEASHIPEGYSVEQAGLAEDGQGNEATYYPSTTYYEQPSEETDAQWPDPMDVEAGAESSGEDDEPSQAEDSKGKKPRKEKPIVNVRVTLIPHRTRKDECEFRDAKNTKQTTLRSDWKEKHDGRKTYFEFKGKSHRYRCEKIERHRRS
ncbi:hypothetical protein LZL87_014203 [Fusarium oxysporum]|nr:hypothetical protein LZL87_014203 [Fusarium oxysporum]